MSMQPNHFAITSRQDIANHLSSANFFPLLMDGTTDKGNIEDEMFLALRCDVESTDERVHTRMSYFALARPK